MALWSVVAATQSTVLDLGVVVIAEGAIVEAAAIRGVALSRSCRYAGAETTVALTISGFDNHLQLLRLQDIA